MGEQEFWTKGLSHNEYCVHFGNKRLFPFVDDFNVNIWDLLTNLPLEFVGKTVNAGHSPSHSSLGLRASSCRPPGIEAQCPKVSPLKIMYCAQNPHTNSSDAVRSTWRLCVEQRGRSQSLPILFSKNCFIFTVISPGKKKQQHKNKTPLATQKPIDR